MKLAEVLNKGYNLLLETEVDDATKDKIRKSYDDGTLTIGGVNVQEVFDKYEEKLIAAARLDGGLESLKYHPMAAIDREDMTEEEFNEDEDLSGNCDWDEMQEYDLDYTFNAESEYLGYVPGNKRFYVGFKIDDMADGTIYDPSEGRAVPNYPQFGDGELDFVLCVSFSMTEDGNIDNINEEYFGRDHDVSFMDGNYDMQRTQKGIDELRKREPKLVDIFG